MNKKILLKVMYGVVLLAAALVWLLAVANVISIEGGKVWAWGMLVLTVGWGTLLLVFDGLFLKNKLKIWVGTGILLLSLFPILSLTSVVNGLVLPIIATVIAAVALLSVLFFGGSKWDSADNEKVGNDRGNGYKNYVKRMEAKEKAEQDKENNND